MVLYSFNGVTLPDGNARFDNPAGPAVDGQMATLNGGVFDGFGEDPVQVRLPVAVALDAVVLATAILTLDEHVHALRALVGQRGTLIRREVDESNEQWATARLVAIRQQHEPGHVMHQPMRFEFVLQSGWEGTDEELATEAMPAGETAFWLVLDHSGSTREQRDVIITVTAGSATISEFGMDFPTSNASWRWKGELLPGETLIIDCGQMSILNETVDAYDGLTFTGNHRSDTWLALPANSVQSAYFLWTDDAAGLTDGELRVTYRKAFW